MCQEADSSPGSQEEAGRQNFPQELISPSTAPTGHFQCVCQQRQGLGPADSDQATTAHTSCPSTGHLPSTAPEVESSLLNAMEETVPIKAQTVNLKITLKYLRINTNKEIQNEKAQRSTQLCANGINICSKTSLLGKAKNWRTKRIKCKNQTCQLDGFH